MKPNSFTFVLASFCISMLCVQAKESIQSNDLEQLRKQYHSARDALAEINSTREEALKREKNLPDDQERVNSQEILKVWHSAFLKCNSSYEKFIFSLVKTFATLPAGNPELKGIQEELMENHPKNIYTAKGDARLIVLKRSMVPLGNSRD
jgi:hypothetical protein